MVGKWFFFILTAGLLLDGCTESVYRQTEMSWNGWIGSTKDERVKDQGIPTRCHAFKSGGEACEWPITWAPNDTGIVTFSFDSTGTACQWTYKDSYSERRSKQRCP